MKKFPELFDRDYLELLIDTRFHECLDTDCDHCPHWGELDEKEETCMPDVIMELWRRLRNAENELKAKQEC